VNSKLPQWTRTCQESSTIFPFTCPLTGLPVEDHQHSLASKGSAEGLGIGGGGGGREQGTRSGRRPGRLKPNIGFPCSYCHVPVSQWKMVLMTLPALRWGGGLETGGEVQAGAAS
jgi:hypothetical protein